MLRLGIDLVDVDEVEQYLAHFGEHYKQRLLDEAERAWLEENGSQPARLAELVAAKEAVIKVIQPGARGLDWRLVGLRPSGPGRFALVASGAAAEAASAAGVAVAQVNVAHTPSHALALAFASSAGEGTDLCRSPDAEPH